MINIIKYLGENFNFGFDEMDEPIEIEGCIKVDYEEIRKIDCRLKELVEERRYRELEARKVAKHIFVG